jgi:hypothetical protein
LADPIIDNYSIFVNVLTITLGILGVAITGGFFGMYQFLAHRLENRIKEKARIEIQIEKARMYIGHGFMYWTDYTVSDSADDIKIKYLRQAIVETKRGLGIIEEHTIKIIDDYRTEIIKCYGMNNLAYYYYTLPKKEQTEGTIKLAKDYATYVYNKILLFPEYRDSWTDTYNKVVLAKVQD